MQLDDFPFWLLQYQTYAKESHLTDFSFLIVVVHTHVFDLNEDLSSVVCALLQTSLSFFILEL